MGYMGTTIGFSKRDTWSLDYSSYCIEYQAGKAKV